MKPLLIFLLPALALLSPSCTSYPSAGGEVPVTPGVIGSADVPIEVIAALPQRILQGKLSPNTNPFEYINQLGLGPWSNNLSEEMKYDSYFLYLDPRHMLQIRCLHSSVTISEDDARAIQNGQLFSSSAIWLKDPIVIGCTLRQDWQTVLVHRIY